MIKFVIFVYFFPNFVKLDAFESRMKLIVPLLFQPSHSDSRWQAVANASSQINVISIIKPKNLHQQSLPDTNYQSSLTNLKQTNLQNAGSYILAYISAGFGTRNLTDIKSDILKYSSWPENYRVDGIYLDEIYLDFNTWKNKKRALKYREIYRYIKEIFGNQSLVISNLAEMDRNIRREYVCENENFLGVCFTDIAVTFLDIYKNWMNYEVTSDSIARNHRQAVIIHGCLNYKEMKKAIKKADESNIGYVFATGNFQWDTLPSYFLGQVEYTASLNSSNKLFPTSFFESVVYLCIILLVVAVFLTFIIGILLVRRFRIVKYDSIPEDTDTSKKKKHDEFKKVLDELATTFSNKKNEKEMSAIKEILIKNDSNMSISSF